MLSYAPPSVKCAAQCVLSLRNQVALNYANGLRRTRACRTWWSYRWAIHVDKPIHIEQTCEFAVRFCRARTHTRFYFADTNVELMRCQTKPNAPCQFSWPDAVSHCREWSDVMGVRAPQGIYCRSRFYSKYFWMDRHAFEPNCYDISFSFRWIVATCEHRCRVVVSDLDAVKLMCMLTLCANQSSGNERCMYICIGFVWQLIIMGHNDIMYHLRWIIML